MFDGKRVGADRGIILSADNVSDVKIKLNIIGSKRLRLKSPVRIIFEYIELRAFNSFKKLEKSFVA